MSKEKEKVKVVFQETNTDFLDAVPGTPVTISVEYYNDQESPIKVDVEIKAEGIPELMKKLDFEANGNQATNLPIPFIIPQTLKRAEITVIVKPKLGIFGYGTPKITRTLTLRAMTQRKVAVVTSKSVQDLIAKLKESKEPLVLSIDPDKSVGPVPIVGDVTSAPNIMLSFQTNEGIIVNFPATARVIDYLGRTSRNSNRILDELEEDRMYLKTFTDEFAKYLGSRGLQVAADKDIPIHIKATGPGLNYFAFSTLVSPGEDETIDKKIESIANVAKKHNALVTILTDRIDESLTLVSQKYNFNVIDIFNGLIVKSWLLTDLAEEYIRDKLGLDLTEYVGVKRGKYSPEKFKTEFNKSLSKVEAPRRTKTKGRE